MTILVIGMHRSGTSAITKAIASMGAYVGPQALLLPPAAGNPEGFYERTDALAINRGIMRLQNCNWHEIPYWDNVPESVPAWVSRGIASCVDDLQSHSPYVFKDPRLCLTLPYWRPHFARQPTVVLVLRHPAAIANSLFRRNNIPHEQGLALWEQYMTNALANIENMTVIRVSFEDMLADPQKGMENLLDAISPISPIFRLPDAPPVNPAHITATSDKTTLSYSQQLLYDRLCSR